MKQRRIESPAVLGSVPVGKNSKLPQNPAQPACCMGLEQRPGATPIAPGGYCVGRVEKRSIKIKIIICVTESSLQRSKTTENYLIVDPNNRPAEELCCISSLISLFVHISCHLHSQINTKLEK